MKGDFRRYWRDPGYYRYLWRNRVGKDVKIALVVFGAFVLGVGGFAFARYESEGQAVVLYTTERVLTVVRKLNGRTVTQVETKIFTEPTSTQMLTVVRNGRTVVLPADTVTDTDTVIGTVTNTRTNTETDVRTQTNTETRTNTQTQTNTQTNTETQLVDRPTTLTDTHTTTETAMGPTRTVTETETETETETDTKTVTDTETVTRTETETETETVTEPGKP